MVCSKGGKIHPSKEKIDFYSSNNLATYISASRDYVSVKKKIEKNYDEYKFIAKNSEKDPCLRDIENNKIANEIIENL
ncbi:MAG: hypothetical protein ACRC0A_04205 [Chitinophagaceae bacterium]